MLAAAASRAPRPGLRTRRWTPHRAPWVREHPRRRQARVLRRPESQADLSTATKLKGKVNKGRFVYRTLYDIAQQSQKAIRAELDARGVEYQSFYLVNAILVKGDRNLARTLAARGDVKRIDGNPIMRPELPAPHEPQALEYNPDFDLKAILAAEPGINYVRAPQAWGLGYTGQGIVVGGADTGYRWTHAALKAAYRGWNGTTADHNYNWHDSIHSGSGACGANNPQPCDDQGHGTHHGNFGGLGRANQVGMAPGARWTLPQHNAARHTGYLSRVHGVVHRPSIRSAAPRRRAIRARPRTSLSTPGAARPPKGATPRTSC